MYERIRTDSILSFLDRTNNQQDKEREGGGWPPESGRREFRGLTLKDRKLAER